MMYKAKQSKSKPVSGKPKKSSLTTGYKMKQKAVKSTGGYR